MVYFNDAEVLDGTNAVSRALVDYVRKHPPTQNVDNRLSDLPKGIASVRIAHPFGPSIPRWRCGEASYVPVLDRTLVEDTIHKKDSLVAKYREACSEVWLVAVASLFPLSSSFGVPHGIEDWKAEFHFDRVFLLSGEEGAVYEVKKLLDKPT